MTPSRVPLRTQLTAVFVVLLLVGLTLTGVTALTLLRQSLVDRLDDQLAGALPGLVASATRGLPGPPRADGSDTQPSDYHVQFSSADGEVQILLPASAGTTASEPDLPQLTVGEVVALGGEPFTVGATSGGERWRALARALVGVDGSLVGSVTVALPMTSAEATLTQMRAALVAIGGVVVGLAAVAGWWAVRRALEPLARIEDTAAAIAAGDLSRRVPDAPTTTEVGRLAAALNGMLGQIEQAFAARTASEQRMRRFVADASHELRTPLATIRGYGELYRMGALTTPEEIDGTVRRIEDSATRMGTLVEDLLHLARLDEGRPLRREPVDLAVVATDAAADLRALDPSRTVRVVPLTDAGTVGGAVTVGDEGRLRQVVANLVGNVVRHTPAGTPAEIAVGRAGDGVVLEVRDHGPGIDPSHAARVFERFYRVDAARGRGTGGAGLGLAIVAAIVDGHGGTVEVSPTAGGGTTVRVTLPAAPGEGSPAATGTEAATPTATTTPTTPATRTTR